MMAGNPNWWNMHPPSLIPPQYVFGSSSIPFNSLTTENAADPPQSSWSQLLFTGLPGEEERLGFSHFQPKDDQSENWDVQIVNPTSRVPILQDVIKQEVSQSGNNLYGHDQFQASGPTASSSWSHMVMPAVSSPRTSTVTNNNNNNMLDFTYNKADHRNNQLPDQTSECNSSSIGVTKKARVQPSSSSQAPLKVRKEKLGDRITALHQLVSPFGKTDTASVLLEAIGYIRFLQGQIEALSSPYLDMSTAASKNMRNHHQSAVVVHGGERNSVFPEDPGQLLDDTGLKRKGAPNQDAEAAGKAMDLRSRGLCLVPVSCTQHVGSENGADYWAPAFGSGF